MADSYHKIPTENGKSNGCEEYPHTANTATTNMVLHPDININFPLFKLLGKTNQLYFNDENSYRYMIYAICQHGLTFEINVGVELSKLIPKNM